MRFDDGDIDDRFGRSWLIVVCTVHRGSVQLRTRGRKVTGRGFGEAVHERVADDLPHTTVGPSHRLW